VAARSKARFCSRSLAGFVVSNPDAVMYGVSCECYVYCHVQVSATGQSLVHGSPTEYGVPECDLETSTMRRPKPTRTVETWKIKCLNFFRLHSLYRLDCTVFIDTYKRRKPFRQSSEILGCTTIPPQGLLPSQGIKTQEKSAIHWIGREVRTRPSSGGARHYGS
jgi:hypothetical protein